MGKITKRLIGTAFGAVLIAGAAAVSHGVTETLMQVALDREEPGVLTKLKRRLMGSKKNRELFAMLAEKSKALEEKASEEIEIVAGDKTRLVGHLRRCESAERIIIAMHGWRSSWSQDFGAIADFWHDNGCTVLYAEQRGQNRSGGDYMGFGMKERYDCLDWVNYLNKSVASGLPVYLCGLSMGATTVLMSAGLALPDNVVGIAADCGFTSPDAIWKHVVEKNLHISYGLRSASANEICKRKLNMSAGEYSAMDALKKTHIPVLFIHGTDDRFVPIEMTYENYKACASEKRLLIVPGAEHGTSYITDKAAYEGAMLAFWQSNDKRYAKAISHDS